MADFSTYTFPSSITNLESIGLIRALDNGVHEFSAICASRTDTNKITVFFSSEITNRSETTTAGNYTIAGPTAITVSSAAIGTDNASVVLTISGTLATGEYTVTVAANTAYGEWAIGTTPPNAETNLTVEILNPIVVSPVVENISPTPGTAIAPTAAISFDVAKGSSTISLVVVAIETSGRNEIAYDGAEFTTNYLGSTHTVNGGGDHHFSIIKSIGGWISGLNLRVYAVGNDDEVAE